ncbi:MAG: DUF4383 domain-containing protein [Actinomycetota bacterium]
MRDAATEANPGRDLAETGSGWTPARIYLAGAGVYLVVVGAVGFLYDASFPVGAEEAARAGSDHVFGVFETNGWHNLAGLVFGVIALLFLTRPRDAVLGALVVGVPNAATFVAFLVEEPTTFWFASNGADAVAHAALGFGGIVAALLSRGAAGRATPPSRAAGLSPEERRPS